MTEQADRRTPPTSIATRHAAEDRGRRWTGARRKALLTVHIAAAVALLGTSSGLLITAVRAATRGDHQQAHTLYELMRVLTYSLGIPFSFIALGGGVLLAVTSKWGLLRYWWVTAKLALLLATIVVGALLTGPSIDTMLEATGPSGVDDDDAQWTLVAAVGSQIAMVLSANVLAVFKPGGRRRWPRRRARR
jgi:uncharacterized membrane protein